FARLSLFSSSLAAPWPRRWGPCLGRRDSHADQGAVATQFSNSTETGTSPPGFRQKVLCQRAGVRLVRGRGAPSKQASHLSPRLEVQDTLCRDVDTRSSFRVLSNPGPPPADVEATESAQLD